MKKIITLLISTIFAISLTSCELEGVLEIETSSTTDTQDTILNVDNCPELSEVLSAEEFDPAIKEFATKYKGRTIEFDGHTAYVSHHKDYDTRFDYLIYTGDYNSKSKGPSFQLQNVNYYDLNLIGDNVPDTFDVGLNIHIVAKIDTYDEDSGLFQLKPVSISIR